jgi:hypothetical protein
MLTFVTVKCQPESLEEKNTSFPKRVTQTRIACEKLLNKGAFGEPGEVVLRYLIEPEPPTPIALPTEAKALNPREERSKK